MPAPTSATMRSLPTRQIFQEDIRWLEDMPPGGDLLKYRDSASFCWKRLRIVLEDPDKIRLKVRLSFSCNNITSIVSKLITDNSSNQVGL